MLWALKICCEYLKELAYGALPHLKVFMHFCMWGCAVVLAVGWFFILTDSRQAFFNADRQRYRQIGRQRKIVGRGWVWYRDMSVSVSEGFFFLRILCSFFSYKDTHPLFSSHTHSPPLSLSPTHEGRVPHTHEYSTAQYTGHAHKHTHTHIHTLTQTDSHTCMHELTHTQTHTLTLSL